MNYSAPRKMLWFKVIMGGPEMARRPATPHIYFRPWQSCHARSRKPATVEKTCSSGKWLVLGTGKDTLPFGRKIKLLLILALSMFTYIHITTDATYKLRKWSYLKGKVTFYNIEVPLSDVTVKITEEPWLKGVRWVPSPSALIRRDMSLLPGT